MIAMYGDVLARGVWGTSKGKYAFECFWQDPEDGRRQIFFSPVLRSILGAMKTVLEASLYVFLELLPSSGQASMIPF